MNNTETIMSKTVIKKAIGRAVVLGLIVSIFYVFSWGGVKFILTYASLYLAIYYFERFHRLIELPGPYALSRSPKAVFDWLWSGFK